LKKIKVLIAGGTGFIGYHLAKACLKKKWIVTSLSLNKPKKIRKLKKVRYLVCDISKRKNITDNIKGHYDYVFNFAGYVDHKNKNKNFNSHFLGCKNLAKFFLNKKLKRFIQIGSSIEYGKKFSPQKESNISKRITNSFYGQAKLLSTNYLLDLFKKNFFPSTILRLYLVYGPYQDANRVIPIVILNCLNNRKFPCSEGIQYRDFIYVDDLINVIFKVLDNENTIGEVYNIGTGKPVMIRSLIKLIKRITKKGTPLYGKLKFRKDEIKKLYPDISKIKKKLKWTPKISLKYGLKKTIKYYKNVI
jgi:nucleoside-diphosphate-sugar epimerase